ncbi:16S rRNA (guanine(527)-N(7))-methyltransferase RsmG [Mariprofundus ferrooxydans]|jgi:16S rRNA (guanine(527)-N(7))-methyltransferase RsmG|uniref:Ribosomal RNA small subunit methyltransferase G n=1 Tax=Mariprofundus ferrooxydans PV-1 TaxID=314345 RepID=Q0EVY0_9PROT|nr:RsmG family class I SAM-dependent methyltransferase [Mariprofundus ferrooxydans]EAU53425.1 hypothetical protein SPV1_12110 [Mariprofundus ferrooxydans PV-1]KON47619.1 hypothetical protein AL013_06500 [Mariprofundus ferrooxydans]
MSVDLCDAYVSEVMRFRKALNLTSISTHDEFVERFILPSLALLDWVPDSGRLLDIGSGMGVPGIPLLLARSGLHGLLVERRKKRAEFLRHIVRTLDLNAEVFDADINHLPSLSADVCVARAVTDERELLTMCNQHVGVSAVAVLPVPATSQAVSVVGWGAYDERTVDVVGSQQLIRCYRHDKEGST